MDRRPARLPPLQAARQQRRRTRLRMGRPPADCCQQPRGGEPVTNLIPRDWEEPGVQRATCRSIGVSAFFPEIGEDWQQAMKVCAQCPVRLQCLDYAMRMEAGASSKTRMGIWGGMTPGKRKRYEAQWLAEQEIAA